MENTQEIFERMPEISHAWSFGFFFWAVAIGVLLALVVNIGPAFITLVQTSLHRGFVSAAWFATGVILNDALVVALCIMTSIQVVTHNGSEAALACIGAGVVLMLFGFFTFRKKVQVGEEMDRHSEGTGKERDEKPEWYVFLGKGFAFNSLNPFVWLLWFSAVAVTAGKMGGDKVSTIVFFAIVLGTSYTMEILKAWGAAKLQKFLTPKRVTAINRLTGVMLMLFGAYFVVFRGIVNLI